MVGWDGDYGDYGIFSESHKKKPQFDSSDGFGFVQFFDISLIFPNINMKKKWCQNGLNGWVVHGHGDNGGCP